MGSQIEISKLHVGCISVPKIFANIADPDEMPYFAAFHLGLHCLPKNMYLFVGIQNEKELKKIKSQKMRLEAQFELKVILCILHQFLVVLTFQSESNCVKLSIFE